MTKINNSISRREKFLMVEQTMMNLFLERTDMVKFSMLCLAIEAGMVVVGERGTGKTKFFQTLSDLIKLEVKLPKEPTSAIQDGVEDRDADDANMLEYLAKVHEAESLKKFFEVGLNSYSVPDEIFGPLDIEKLKRGIYQRVVENFAPNSLMTFFDEVFKAKDQTLNSFLKFILEKKFFVNGQEHKAKTKWFFAASNEFGAKDKLAPFEDRFQVWLPAFYLDEDKNFMSLMKANCNGFPTYQKEIITVDELAEIKKEIDAVVVTEDTLKGLLDIRKKFFGNNIRVSDRTFCRLLPMIKYSAWYDNRTETNTDDLELIWVSCWEHNPDMKAEIAKTQGIIQSVIGMERENLIALQDKVEAFIATSANDPDLASTVMKIEEIKKEVAIRKIKKSNEEVRKSVLRSINNVIVLLSDMATRRKK